MRAIMVINRLPTVQELDQDCMECEFDMFAEEFNQQSVTGLIAEVIFTKDEKSGSSYIQLGEGGWKWQHNPDVDWYTVKVI